MSAARAFLTTMLAVAVASAASAPHPRLRLEVARAPRETRSCAVSARLCVSEATADPIVAVRVHGSRRVVEAFGRGVAGLGRARETGGQLALHPPLAVGCIGPIELPVAVKRPVRLRVTARTMARRALEARAVLRCRGAQRARPARTPPRLVFTREVIDSQGGGQVTESLGAGDLDGDGRPDVVVGGDERLVWYHDPDWALREIARGRWGSGAMTVVRDLDGDGRQDVVSGSNRETIWFGNTPAGWAPHVLSTAAYCHDLAFGDLDGDGRPDAVCVDQARARIVWLRAPADATAPWSLEVIDANRNAMGAAVADIDGDGRLDVVAGRAWYRNRGDGSWTRVPYTSLAPDELTAFADYAKVTVLDLDGDGRPDIFATLFAESPIGRVLAFLAPADSVREPWTAVPIDAGPLFGVHSQAAAAFDGSSRPQIMVGETGIGGWDFGVNPDPHIYVYRLLGHAVDPARRGSAPWSTRSGRTRRRPST
jgi:VCBS repeat protein/FG-GAP repeat protein